MLLVLALSRKHLLLERYQEKIREAGLLRQIFLGQVKVHPL